MLRRTASSAWLASIAIGALACGGRPASVAPVAAAALEFIRDDWPRALAEAKRRQVPLFVEAWAPW